MQLKEMKNNRERNKIKIEKKIKEERKDKTNNKR